MVLLAIGAGHTTYRDIAEWLDFGLGTVTYYLICGIGLGLISKAGQGKENTLRLTAAGRAAIAGYALAREQGKPTVYKYRVERVF